MEHSMAKVVLWVALGGAAGSVVRFLFSVWIKPSGGFPWPTLAVNILGCFAIGLVYGFTSRHASEQMRLVLATGFCGGFTTFSAFGYENLTLIQSQQYALASAYVAASIVGGMAAVWLGNSLADKW